MVTLVSYRCPRCDYDMAGLPAEHTCPECGLDCDPRCQYIKLHRSRWHLGQIILGAGFLAALYYLNRKSGGLGFVLPGIIGAAIVWHLLLGLRRTTEESYVLLNQKGIFLHLPPAAPRTFQWESISAARLSFLTGKFQLIGVKRRTLFQMPANRLGSQATVSQVIHTTNYLASIYESAGETGS